MRRRSRPRIASRLPACLLISSLLFVPPGASLRAYEIVAPSPAGTSWDTIAQTIRNALEAVGEPQPNDIRNMPGNGGTLALGRFLMEAGDEDLLVTGLPMMSASLMHRVPVSPDRLTPIARLCSEPFWLAVSAQSAAKNAAELQAQLLADPAKITFGGGPLGGIDHLAAIQLARAVGMDASQLRYVAFLTSADAAAALADGRIGTAFLLGGEFKAEAVAKNVRVLAQSDTARPGTEGPPSLQDSGIPLELTNWRGLVARPGLDPAQRAALAARVAKALSAPAWQELLDKKGWRNSYLPPEPFQTFLTAEKTRLTEASRMAGVQRPAD